MESSEPLSGRVALVTGCGRKHGMGRAIALELARAGADIAVNDVVARGTRNLAEPAASSDDDGWGGVAELADEIVSLGRKSKVMLGDVGLKEVADRIVEEAVEEFGELNVLVNNAAAPHAGEQNLTWEVPEEAFDTVLRVNTKGVFLVSSAFIRYYVAAGKTWGRIVNIASGAGRRGYPRQAAYCASKAGVISLTQTMALEVASLGITVNAVCPGLVETARSAAGTARGQAVLGPVGRIGEPEDVSRTVRFLADPSAGYITGQALNVDGGLILN